MAVPWGFVVLFGTLTSASVIVRNGRSSAQESKAVSRSSAGIHAGRDQKVEVAAGGSIDAVVDEDSLAHDDDHSNGYDDEVDDDDAHGLLLNHARDSIDKDPSETDEAPDSRGWPWAPIAPSPPPPPKADVLMIQAGIREALSRWDEEASKHDIQYHIEYGSLLGWARGESIIPHDTDADLLIDVSSIPALEKLALDTSEETSFFVDAGNHSSLPHDGTFVLFRATSHQKDFEDFTRVDCKGRDAGTKSVDQCSFSGPVGRIIYFGGDKSKKAAHVDLFLAGCPYRDDSHAKNWKCRKSTNDCTYCPSKDAVPNALIEQAGELQRCSLSGVSTWCPKSRTWIESHLQGVYGDGWKIEDRPL